MTTKDEREPFLSRWSRRKQEARDEPAPKEPAAPDEGKPAPELPPVDQLNYESDFKDFMDKRVDDKLRRLALKKLFTDPRFNVTDGLDDYAEDYSLLEDLPSDMVALQQHARRILRSPEEAAAADSAERQGAEESVAARHGEQPADQGETRAAPESVPSEGEPQRTGEAGASDASGEKDERHG